MNFEERCGKNRSLFLTGLLTCLILASASCKTKKKGSSGSPSNPIADTNSAGDASSGCSSSLTVLNLEPADPADLRLNSVDMEAIAIGAFQSAKIVFELAEGSPRPSKYIYTVSSTNINPKTGKKSVIVGSSSSPADINNRIPPDAVSLKAWACISGNRLPGAKANIAMAEQKYSARKLAIPELGTYYFCGDPVNHFDHQKNNASIGEFATLQEEIDSLRRDAEKTAFQLVSAIGESMKGASLRSHHENFPLLWNVLVWEFLGRSQFPAILGNSGVTMKISHYFGTNHMDGDMAPRFVESNSKTVSPYSTFPAASRTLASI